MSGMVKGKPKISQAFQRWLLVLVAIAFLATTAFLWVIQSELSERSAIGLLKLNISDVRQDISDASDERLMELTERIAAEVEASPEVDGALLLELMGKYDVTEISIIGDDGIIDQSTSMSFEGFDMASGEQSAEFLVLLEGEESYVQSYQPISYDSSINRKYAGVALEDGGFIQVGYGAQRFQRDMAEFVVGVTRNRHVSSSGSIIIADENGVIVSDRHENEGKLIEVTGVTLDEASKHGEEAFMAEVYGEKSYCMYRFTEGYHVLASIPQSELALARNITVGIMVAMQIIVFAALFVMIYVLVKRQVVCNINRVNDSLSAISDGDLDTVVDVRTHAEFDELSNDINTTVNTLKRYIADAAARVDAELAFAKAIQHSALPSVFPPFPNRTDFGIWAIMRTAKEVGGDFYDFYFIDEDTLAFVVADVSGKGIPAAMFMMQSKTLLKSCAESGMSVEEVFTVANQKLSEGNEAGMFVTAWMGCLNLKTGKLLFANAGHNPPVIRHAGGDFEYLKVRPNFVLGGMEGVRYRKNEVNLLPGDSLFLYTDGVTEAVDVRNELYGEDRLLDTLNRNAACAVQDMCDAVVANVDAFAGEAPQFDDITMLYLTYHPTIEEEHRVKELTLPATVENIHVATSFVNDMLVKNNCPPKAQMQIAIAIDELFGNIAKYAYVPGSGEATVRVEIEEEPLAAVVTFIDQGMPFDPLARTEPDTTLPAEKREIGGLGILMVKRSMDEISYNYVDGSNVLRIKRVF